MVWLLLVLGLSTFAIVGHGVATGTLQVKGGIERARFPKTFWFVCAALTLAGFYLLWLAWYDFLR